MTGTAAGAASQLVEAASLDHSACCDPAKKRETADAPKTLVKTEFNCVAGRSPPPNTTPAVRRDMRTQPLAYGASAAKAGCVLMYGARIDPALDICETIVACVRMTMSDVMATSPARPKTRLATAVIPAPARPLIPDSSQSTSTTTIDCATKNSHTPVQARA